MAQLPQAFDPSQHTPSREGGSQLPVGRHQVVIQADEIANTSSNNGHRLVLSLLAIDGPAKNQVHKHGLNLFHNNPQTRQIAEDELTSICYVVGHFGNVTDTAVLHNKPFFVEIGLQANSDKGYTEVKKVYDVNGNTAQQILQNRGNGGGAPQGQGQQFGAQQGGNNFGGQQPNNSAPQGGWNQPQQQQAPAPQQAPQNGGWGNPGAAAASAPAPQQQPQNNWQQQQPPQGQQSQGNGGWQGSGGTAPWGGR